MTVALERQPADVLVACRIAQHQGLTEAFGHISVREGDRMVITPRAPVSAVRSVDDLVEIDLSAEPIEIGSGVPPEAYMHIGIYQARPDVNAVFRFHAPFELAISTAVDEFRPAIGYGAYVGVVPVHPGPRQVRDCRPAHESRQLSASRPRCCFEATAPLRSGRSRMRRSATSQACLTPGARRSPGPGNTTRAW